MRLKRDLGSRLRTGNLAALIGVIGGCALIASRALGWQVVGGMAVLVGVAAITAPVRIRQQDLCIGWGPFGRTIDLGSMSDVQIEVRDFRRAMGRLSCITYRPARSSGIRVVPGSVALRPDLLDVWLGALRQAGSTQ